jgi:hypothetical protein
MNYKFQYIEECAMCGAPNTKFNTLGKRLNKSQGANPRRKVGITVTIQQCSWCDLIFSNPMPIPESLQDHYGVPPENYWVDSYFTVDENYFRGVINWFAENKDITRGLKALDIGAGIGKCMITELSHMDFLVNIENSDSPAQVPSKLIDYAISGRPILSINPIHLNEQTILEFLKFDFIEQYKIENIGQYHINTVAIHFL